METLIQPLVTKLPNKYLAIIALKQRQETEMNFCVCVEISEVTDSQTGFDFLLLHKNTYEEAARKDIFSCLFQVAGAVQTVA